LRWYEYIKIYGNDDYVESEYDNNRDSFVTFGDEENEGVLLTSGFESTSTMTAIINPHAGPIDASTGFISVGALVCTIPGVIGLRLMIRECLYFLLFGTWL